MPTLTNVDGAYFPAADVNTTPQLIDPGVTLTDAEGDFDGGTLVVSGLLAEDIVGLLSTGNAPGEIFLFGAVVLFGGVPIGTVSGGNGVDLVVTFNADATTAGVEATIEALTYQNPSATPTELRELSIVVTDAAGENTLRDQYFEAATQPFDPGVDLVDSSTPTLGDLDGDGDLDLVVGDGYGNLHYFENTGSAAAPAFSEVTGALNPFDGFDGDRVKPKLVDLDGDGDLDLAVGEYNGTIRYLRNDAGVFTEQAGAGNPMGGIDIGYGASPAYADMDGDLDLDLVVGRSNGDIHYFENIGDQNAAVFVERTDGGNPFDNWSLPGLNITLADIDGDGDFDLATGMAEGPVIWLQNTGTAASPVFAGGDFTLFANVDIFFGGAPAFGDLDGDGDLELVVGNTGGALTYFEVALRPTIIEIMVDAGATPADDAFAGPEGDVVTGDVFADNGAGADSAGATVIEVNGEAADVGQQITLASGALLTLNADGTFSYDPNGAFDDLAASGSGGGNQQRTDSFTYTVNGGDTATVTIQLSGVDSDDLVTGSTGDDLLEGGVGDDTLEGGDGSDYLRGGAGADAMFGGLGNDTYVADDAGDTADETGGGGVDTVLSRVSFVLGAGVEHLTLGASGLNIDGTGNALGNEINGNAFENVLSGLDGNDVLFGNARNDILYGGDGLDYLDGGTQDDQLYGGADYDVLVGGAGNDLVDGGTGGDTMLGGLGHDIYVVDDLTDTVTEFAGGGTDTVRSSVDWALGSDVEHLTLTGSADIDGTGNGLRNTITGNGGVNVLDGGGEIDTLFGEGGDDTLRGGDGADILHGGAGADQVYGDAHNDTLHGDAGEDTLYGGAANDTLYGGADQDQLWGEAGADYLDGGAGVDFLVGGTGNDTYVVDTESDAIIEGFNEGIDLILSSAGGGIAVNVENMTLTGSANLDGYGNDMANVILGNSGDNGLEGGFGADTLSGADGDDILLGGYDNDTLNGGAGDDQLSGGAGFDRLTGGAGKDVFLFTQDDILALGMIVERDQILDLNFAEGDRIDLSGIDGDVATDADDSFTFVSKFTGVAGQATLKYVAGNNVTNLELDVDGDGKADFRLAINGDHSGTTGNLYTGEGDANGGWLL